jgi:hypothetical protein
LNPDATPPLPARSGTLRVRYFARAYEADADGSFRVAVMVEADSEADSLAAAERLSREHVGAIAFALRSPWRPVLHGLGRFGQTPD